MTATKSAEERVQAAFDKIDQIDRNGYKLNSIIATSSVALDEARSYDKSNENLPLGGKPILIKDNIEVRGLPATAGSLALAGAPAERDAHLVKLLRKAGAIVVGVTNLSEWANIRSSQSTSGWSAVGGLTANPWIHKRNAGGSSSGSGAAVAAGLAQWAIGSETDGSIICPASLNGTVGVKPSSGAIPSHGIIPISRNRDVPGPMTQTVEQSAELLSVLLDRPGLRRTKSDASGLQIAVVKNWRTTDESTNSLCEEAVRKVARHVSSVSEIHLAEPESSDSSDEIDVLLHELVDDLADYLAARPNSPMKSLNDIVAFNEANSERELQHFNQDFFLKALELSGKSGPYQEKFDRNLKWAQKTLDQGFASADILIGCTFGPAWESNLSLGDSKIDATWLCMAPAIAGYPVGTLPMGLVEGLPVGIGVVAKKGREDQLLTAMTAIEGALDLGVLKPTFLK